MGDDRHRVAEEVRLLRVGDLAQVLDTRVAEQRLDLPLEVRPVNRIHLGGDEELDTRPAGNLHRAIHALLRGDPPQEGQVPASSGAGSIEPGREPVVNRAHPPRVGQRGALRVRDGDHRDV